MKIFGFNISRQSGSDRQSASDPNQNSKVKIQKSLSSALLRGDDLDHASSVLSNAYEQVVWVYRAINVLAEQIANIPFVFSKGVRGRETLITSGPLLDFYNRPDQRVNRFQYWELRVMWLMLRGE